MPEELTKKVVLNWVLMATGPFQLQDISRELGIASEEGRSNLRVIMHRLVGEKIVERMPNKDGLFRPIDGTLKVMEWQGVDVNNFLLLDLPFGIHEYAKIFPKSIVIVAGSKNQGKTEFLYDTIYRNMWNPLIEDLYNTETGPEQMKERFDSFSPPVPCPAPFTVYERYDNFADVIHPEHISIIDYMDLNSEVYLVGEEIDRIFRRLTTGVAFIGLQKPPGRDLAYGGSFTAKRSVLYISLDNHICKLVFVKNPMQKRVNPNNMQFTYDFDENGHFTNIQRKYGE